MFFVLKIPWDEWEAFQPEWQMMMVVVVVGGVAEREHVVKI